MKAQEDDVNCFSFSSETMPGLAAKLSRLSSFISSPAINFLIVIHFRFRCIEKKWRLERGWDPKQSLAPYSRLLKLANTSWC